MDNGPNGIAFDKEGNIYAPDGAAHRVLKLSPAGKVIQVFGPMKGSFKYVHVVVDGGGNLFVVEPEQNAIEKFTPMERCFRDGTGSAAPVWASGKSRDHCRWERQYSGHPRLGQ